MCNRKNTIILCLAVFALSMMTEAAFANVPLNYYSSLKGLKKDALKTAVYNIIKNATVLSYGSGAGKTWEGFYSTDRRTDNSAVDRYSNDVRYFTYEGAVVSGMNIEHSFPKSWWGGTENQSYCDLYNLMPCESTINSSKSNYPMGAVTKVTTTNGCTKIGTGNNNYMLWEPADKWKGDFARGYMYMATAYQNLTWTGSQALEILSQGDYPTLQQWAYSLYIKWAKADAPDSVEIARNEVVNKIQGNRNPFVDFPNLMEYIWGDSTDAAFNPETTVKSGTVTSGPVTPTETKKYSANFTSESGECTTEVTTPSASGVSIWTRSNSYGWTATAYKNNTNYESDASLVTPEIDLADCSDATLTFVHAANYFSSVAPSAQLQVNVVCDGVSTTLNGITWPAGNSWSFNSSGSISLKPFVGKKIKIAYRYTSSTSQSGTWEIKSMTVSATANGSSAVHSVRIDNVSRYGNVYDISGRLVRTNADTLEGLRHGVYVVKGRKIRF
jgi:endonuclease I